MNRTSNKVNYFIYLLILINSLLNFFVFSSTSTINANLINPLSWFIILILSTFLLDNNERVKKKKDKIELVFIIVIFYLILYFISGLFFGYSRTIYSHDILSIIKNIWIYIPILILKELTRNKLVKSTSDKNINFIIIMFIFILADISTVNFASVTASREVLFKYSVQTIMPLIFSNVLFTYLARVSSPASSIFYRVVLTLSKLLLPIVPNLDWFLSGLFESVLAVLTFYIIHYYQTIKVDRFINVRPGKERKHLFRNFIICMILIILILFIGGFLKYQPVAIMSGSMEPVFKRGDVVVIEKVDDDSIKNMSIGDIIAYKNNNIIVTHRIIKLEYNTQKNDVSIITKGDNNNTEDDVIITKDMIVGTIRYTIPYVGYPSVLFYELLHE